MQPIEMSVDASHETSSCTTGQKSLSFAQKTIKNVN